MRYDFDDIKKKISLCDFLIDNYGWKHDTGSSARNPKLKSPETGEVIVISRSPKGWDKYFSVHDDTIKGATIFDWMQRQIEQQTGKRPTLYKVAEVLQEYISKGKTVLPHEYSEYQSVAGNGEKSEVNTFLNEVHKVRPMTDFTFMEGRGIRRETLQDDIWKDIFRNKVYIAENGQTHTNTVMLMYNREGVAGISQRGMRFKGALGSRDSSVAMSRVMNKDVTLFIGESLIDCVSHYQLGKDNGRDLSKVQYISTEGQITEGQIKLIGEILNSSDSKLNVKQIVPIFDNDPAGQTYTLKLLGGIDPNAYQYTAQVCNDRIHIQFVAPNPNDVELLFPKRIFEKYTDDFAVETTKTFEKATVYSVSFPNHKDILKELNQHIGEIQFGSRFSMEIPVTKDFNDDLKAGYYRTPKPFVEEKAVEEVKEIRIEETAYVAPLTKEELKMGIAEIEKRMDEITMAIAGLDERRQYYERTGEYGLLAKMNSEILPLKRELDELKSKMEDMKAMEREPEKSKTAELDKSNTNNNTLTM